MHKRYITVLDFEIGKVFQYEVKPLWENMRPRTDYEEFLTSEGHNLSNCEWMVHGPSHISGPHIEWVRNTN